MTTKKKTEVTYRAPELEDANDEPLEAADEPDTDDDTVELFEDEAEPEAAPEPDPDPLDEIPLETLEHTQELRTRRIDECVAELRRERMRLGWPDVQDIGGIVDRCAQLEAECVTLAHGLAYTKQLIALKREFLREEAVERLEGQVVKLEKERDQASAELANAKPGRDRKLAEAKFQLISDELRDTAIRRDSEARSIPWRSRARIEAAIRNEQVRSLKPLQKRRAKHEAILSAGQNHPDYGQAKAHLPAVLESIKETEYRIEQLREQIADVNPRPHSSNPKAWPPKVVNSGNFSGMLARVRDEIDKIAVTP